MSYLVPVEVPDLEPLRRSFEYDQLESELKEAFFAVFEKMIRPAERQLNLYGMPHLGDDVLIERALKDAGMAIVRRNSVRSGFLLKAAKSRNPRRGMLFLAQYLQSVWPNVWKIEQLWHPVALAADYPAHAVPAGVVDLGGDVTAELDANSPDGVAALFRTDWQGKQRLYPTARTNLVRDSSAFDNASWNKIGATVEAAAVLAPDGTVTAYKLVESTDADTGHSVAGPSVTVTATGDYTFSAFCQQAERDSVALYLRNADSSGNYATVAFDLATGTVIGAGSTAGAGYTNVRASITQAELGWYRCSITARVDASVGQMRGWVRARADGAVSYTGDGVSGLYVWGAQGERGTLTAYIATAAEPVSVTDYTLDANGVATFATGSPEPAPATFFRTSRVRVTMPVSSDNGLGLEEVGKAFRPTLAARLLIELQLALTLENTGQNGGLALSCGAAGGAMPFMAIGTLS